MPACTTTPDDREQERQLVGDELRGGRSAPSSANLLALAHPAMSTPITDRLDTASA